MEKVLITGVAGGQGRLVARRLLRDTEVVGVDREPWTTRPPEVPFHQVDLRKRGFSEVMRKEQPDAVVHLGMVRHFRASDAERYDMNVRGTRILLDRCAEFGVKKLVVMSSSYVYGAFPENPYFMDEDHPLSASRNYPEIRDLVEVDALATAFLWRYPEFRTSVLRPVPILGHYTTSAMATYLRMNRPITMLGFNPMIQFLHEEDMTEAIALAVEHDLRGVFNVTGPGEVPLHTALQEVGARPRALPEFVARPLLRRMFRLGLFAFPPGALDYIKFTCTISGRRFVEATGFRPLFSLKETFRSLDRE
jgi:UDP-glucose 4-epimerase